MSVPAELSRLKRDLESLGDEIAVSTGPRARSPLTPAQRRALRAEIQGVIQRLDDSRLPFRDRATRLVTFCASGVLTVGKASAIARETILGYLRRKDFITEFTADIPEPAEKERAIKEFYALLAGTGFNVAG